MAGGLEDEEEGIAGEVVEEMIHNAQMDDEEGGGGRGGQGDEGQVERREARGYPSARDNVSHTDIYFQTHTVRSPLNVNTQEGAGGLVVLGLDTGVDEEERQGCEQRGEGARAQGGGERREEGEEGESVSRRVRELSVAAVESKYGKDVDDDRGVERWTGDADTVEKIGRFAWEWGYGVSGGWERGRGSGEAVRVSGGACVSVCPVKEGPVGSLVFSVRGSGLGFRFGIEGLGYGV